MLENWKQWEGRVVDATLTLRTFLGGSSQSAVYLVDYSTGAEREKAAVKLIPADPQDADAQLARWKRVAELSHPHLIRLLQMGRCELDGVPLLYAVMELADENLSEILPHRPLTAEETCEMLAPILDALAYVHEKGLAHAAIRPAKIMAVGDRVKISSDRLVTVGERSYASLAPSAYDPPEARRGVISPAGAISQSGDVWSLGSTLVEALTQSIPTREWGTSEWPPLPSDLPQPFLDIARQCLRRDAKKRWTVAQIAARMRLPAASVAPMEAVKPSPAAESQRGPKSGRYSLAVMMAVMLTVIFLGARWLRQRHPAAPATARAPDSSPARQISPSLIWKPLVSDGTVAATPRPAPPAPLTHVPEPDAPDDAGVVPAAVVTRVLPDIPQAARDTVQGTVRIAIRVGVDSAGNVTMGTFDLPGPSGYFADRAMRAAKQWKFDPAAGHVPGEWLLRFKITRDSTNVFADTAY
jgi:serine/threonine protein kinase